MSNTNKEYRCIYIDIYYFDRILVFLEIQNKNFLMHPFFCHHFWFTSVTSSEEFFAINLPSLVPVDVSTLPYMEIYLPMHSIDVNSFGTIMVTSHAKDACEGHSSNYAVEVNPEKIESVFLSNFSSNVDEDYCDVQMVMRSNNSLTQTASTQSVTTELSSNTTGAQNWLEYDFLEEKSQMFQDHFCAKVAAAQSF